MEITKNEVEAVIATVSQVQGAIKDLTEMELALTGGGIGDVLLG